VGSPGLKVLKRDERTELFESEKLQRALRRVCRNRPIGDEAIRRIARDIEARLLDAGAKSVRSSQIVDLALARLSEIDKVAYDRLAANYIDEDGALRTDARRLSPEEAAQLGLFQADEM
jgi:transcriptional repressor NrdR